MSVDKFNDTNRLKNEDMTKTQEAGFIIVFLAALGFIATSVLFIYNGIANNKFKSTIELLEGPDTYKERVTSKVTLKNDLNSNRYKSLGTLIITDSHTLKLESGDEISQEQLYLIMNETSKDTKVHYIPIRTAEGETIGMLIDCRSDEVREKAFVEATIEGIKLKEQINKIKNQ